MITIDTYASGSTGNLYRVSDGTTPLLIECGLSVRSIRQHLNFQLSDIAACLVSHEHKDHSKAAEDIMKAGVNCYMSAGTSRALKIENHRLKIVEARVAFTVGTWQILPFESEHDAADPLGFLMQSGGDKLLFLTDSYYCRYKFKNLTHIMVECNYHLPILQENMASGKVPKTLKNRILKSHFSLDNVIEFFKANDLSRVHEIHLLHLSRDNSDPDLFKNEIQRLTGKPVYIGGS